MYIVYELISFDRSFLQEIDGVSRFTEECHAIDRIDEVRKDKWQEFVVLRVYIGKE